MINCILDGMEMWHFGILYDIVPYTCYQSTWYCMIGDWDRNCVHTLIKTTTVLRLSDAWKQNLKLENIDIKMRNSKRETVKTSSNNILLHIPGTNLLIDWWWWILSPGRYQLLFMKLIFTKCNEKNLKCVECESKRKCIKIIAP